MKTLSLTSIAMILAILGLWSHARDHADSTRHRPEPTAHEETVAASDESEVLIRVNGSPITRNEFDLALSSYPEGQREMLMTPAGKKAVAEELIRLELLAQKAESEELGEDEAVQRQLRMSDLRAGLVRKEILAQAALRSMAGKETGEKSLESLYQNVKDDLETADLLQISIGWNDGRSGRGEISRTREEAAERAEEAVGKIRAGEDFRKVQQQYNDDPGLAELEDLHRESLPPDLVEPIFALKPGDVSGALETPWGYHIFKMVSRDVPAFDQVRPQLQSQARQLWTRVAVENLRKDAEVELDPEFFDRQN